MARFSEDEINRIKKEVSLLGLVERQGYEITKQGKDYVVRCPFHDENTPSCVISPKTNLFHCFGCGAGGSVIDWVMKAERLGFRQAVERLQSDIVSAQPQSSKPDQAKKILTDIERQKHLHEVVDYYHDALKQSPEVQAYLRSRGLDDAELIDTFKLGYANRSLAARLPSRKNKAGCELRDQLQEVGLLRESGHEHFNGSLVVPVINMDGDITEVYGRKLLGNQLRKGTPQHLYLPGPHQGVWNVQGWTHAAGAGSAGAVNEQGLDSQKGRSQHPASHGTSTSMCVEVILCESLIDAMSFWVNGFKNVTASYGTQGFTSDHLAAFKAAGVERVLIAYDRDEAGDNAAEKLAKQLEAEGFHCYRIELPKGMDVNAYALQVKPAKKSLELVIKQARYMGAGRPPERQLSLDVELLPADEKPIQLEEKSSVKTPLVEAEIKSKEVLFTFGNRRYRVRGLDKNKNLESLKVNLLATDDEGAMHVDTFDLYAAKVRQVFIKNVAVEFGIEERIVKGDVAKVLLSLEALQGESLNDDVSDGRTTAFTIEEEGEALELLTSPDLLERILSDFSRCGVVGEEVNKLVGYLAASSRKLDKPLAVIIQSTSAAGKSSLMDTVLTLMPEAERVHYSAMTGQSLFYMGETNLKHKILAIAEEEGASNASYALKLLQSEGEITIASTGKDDDTGNLITKEYKVEGPVMLFLTTTAIDIDEELMNRCLVLTVNESREQTRLIHEAQRKRRTLEGLQAKLEKDELIKLHRNAQSLLKPLAVINPYADQLTFLDDKTRTRRDHEKYLTLIDSIALLHQYQRPIKTVSHNDQTLEYIEVQLSDIETANKLAHEVLGRTLDELPAQTRKLLRLIQNMVSAECKRQGIEQKNVRFSRRSLRDVVQWSDTALKVHVARLVELEYLLVHRGRGGRFDYELLFDGAEKNEPHLMGLIGTDQLKKGQAAPEHPCSCGTCASCTSYDENRSGQKAKQSASGQAPVNGRSAQIKSLKPLSGVTYRENGQVEAENALRV